MNLILMRHGENEKTGAFGLTPNGTQFADVVALNLYQMPIRHIYLSNDDLYPGAPLRRMRDTVLPLSLRTGVDIEQMRLVDLLESWNAGAITGDGFIVLVFRSIDFDLITDSTSRLYLPNVAADDLHYHRILVLTSQMSINPPRFQWKRVIHTGIEGRSPTA